MYRPAWRRSAGVKARHDERGEVLLERVYTDGYRLETLPIRRNGSFPPALLRRSRRGDPALPAGDRPHRRGAVQSGGVAGALARAPCPREIAVL
ncbi:MAG: hypothetical protein U0703_24410 [Anaerolineae bacterium]